MGGLQEKLQEFESKSSNQNETLSTVAGLGAVFRGRRGSKHIIVRPKCPSGEVFLLIWKQEIVTGVEVERATLKPIHQIKPQRLLTFPPL